MNSQNVSAQLYNKQLTPDPKEGVYGCDSQTYPYLSTCVDNTKTDTNIENAFQKQLDLSEYYKSPNVFNAMKKEYSDNTMEGENILSEKTPLVYTNNITNTSEPVKRRAVPQQIPVGPTDFLNKFIKSGFGTTGSNVLMFIVITIMIVLGVMAAMHYKQTI